jgi:hypothetical protein
MGTYLNHLPFQNVHLEVKHCGNYALMLVERTTLGKKDYDKDEYFQQGELQGKLQMTSLKCH